MSSCDKSGQNTAQSLVAAVYLSLDPVEAPEPEDLAMPQLPLCMVNLIQVVHVLQLLIRDLLLLRAVARRLQELEAACGDGGDDLLERVGRGMSCLKVNGMLAPLTKQAILLPGNYVMKVRRLACDICSNEINGQKEKRQTHTEVSTGLDNRAQTKYTIAHYVTTHPSHKSAIQASFNALYLYRC